MFKGSIPALVTPFGENGVDFDALKAIVEWHIEQLSHGVVAVGTTGESPTLTHEEHEEVVKVVTETAAKRIPVVAGAGSNNTDESLRLVKFAKSVGADAVLVVTPYYNKPTQQGLYQHYKVLHDTCEIPIIIYNIPGRSVIDMTPDTMGRLARLKRVVGVKDATGDVTRVSKQRQTCGDGFIQLSGEDASALGFNAHGGVGCISVTANVAPKLCAEFQNALLGGNYAAALEYQDRLMPLHTAIFIEPGLAGAKYGMSLLGKCENRVRLPLVPVTPETESKIREAMKFAGVL